MPDQISLSGTFQTPACALLLTHHTVWCGVGFSYRSRLHSDSLVWRSPKNQEPEDRLFSSKLVARSYFPIARTWGKPVQIMCALWAKARALSPTLLHTLFTPGHKRPTFARFTPSVSSGFSTVIFADLSLLLTGSSTSSTGPTNTTTKYINSIGVSI